MEVNLLASCTRMTSFYFLLKEKKIKVGVTPKKVLFWLNLKWTFSMPTTSRVLRMFSWVCFEWFKCLNLLFFFRAWCACFGSEMAQLLSVNSGMVAGLSGRRWGRELDSADRPNVAPEEFKRQENKQAFWSQRAHSLSLTLSFFHSLSPPFPSTYPR